MNSVKSQMEQIPGIGGSIKIHISNYPSRVLDIYVYIKYIRVCNIFFKYLYPITYGGMDMYVYICSYTISIVFTIYQPMIFKIMLLLANV